MRWPWRRPEVRSANYTEQIVSRLVSAASGAAGDGGTLGVVEVAGRWWAAGLASATLKPDNVALRAVSPGILDAVGRALCRSGESLHVISVRNGQVMLTPCAQWSVLGDDDPASWRYLATMNGPTTTRTLTLAAESVLHFRYAPPPDRPWTGRSPMQMARATGRASALLEHATSEEFSFVQRQLLSPRRNQNDFGTVDLTGDLTDKIVAAFSDHTGSGALVVPGDLEPRRLGPEPPIGFGEIRDRIERTILSMHGIPPALTAENANGASMREGFRQLLHGLIKNLAAIVVEELQAKLHKDAALSFDSLRAGDIVSTSRAAGSLVKAGYTPASAAVAVGLDNVEVA